MEPALLSHPPVRDALPDDALRGANGLQEIGLRFKDCLHQVDEDLGPSSSASDSSSPMSSLASALILAISICAAAWRAAF